MDSGYGFKALDPTGATYPDNRRDGSGVMLYALPRPGEKWGPWMDHPNPAEPDGRECGHGRFHIWSSLSLEYGPRNPWPWFVQWEVKIGGDGRKLGVRRLRLRRISPKALARSLRSPFNWGFGACLSNICLSGADLRDAYLSDAYLSDANLSGANLGDAYLSGADLSGANLRDANLGDANLSGANLRGANLYAANLSGADLSGANLYAANLRGANLRGANLYAANLSDAYLSDANLSGANLSGANLRDADLRDADLRDAYLSDAYLSDAIANEYTSWTTDIPDGVTVLQNR